MKPYVFMPLLALAVASCGTDEAPQFQEVCIKEATGQRAADSQCHAKDAAYSYRYLPLTSLDDGSWVAYVPPVGHKLRGAVTEPKEGTVVHDVPPAAGSWVHKDGTGPASFVPTPPPDVKGSQATTESPSQSPSQSPAQSTAGQLRPSFARPSSPPPTSGLHTRLMTPTTRPTQTTK